ncbi:hypothetical protein BDZ97DRAFT_1829294 [Flammula alnicola]|nr:hypothetical protein BDZ97DRAFT_1829294 [Flammula alnicola]
MASKPLYTIIGTPFSSFTRTIALGLQYKGLEYNQISTRAQSQIAQESHPFAYLPTLIIHEIDSKQVDVKLRESQAIVRFIDRVAPEPSLHIQPGTDVEIEEKMWEFVSLAASFGFPMIEAGVVKPRVKALDEGVLSEQEIRDQIKDGVVELKRYLAVAESLMAPEGFAFGTNPTWADFFLFPLLADLRTVPEWEVVSERLKTWTNKMDQLPAVKATTVGTLSAGGRP